MARGGSSRLEPALLNLACLGVALFILAPFAWMLVSSLAGEAELTRRPPVFVPSPPTLANYAFIFTGQLWLMIQRYPQGLASRRRTGYQQQRHLPVVILNAVSLFGMDGSF